MEEEAKGEKEEERKEENEAAPARELLPAKCPMLFN